MIKATILGSGTSQGVPVIACDCHVCLSQDPRDKRLRSSLLIEIDGKNYVIDSGPDFRQQLLRTGIKSLEGILFTHEHKDHVAGLDDVRAFNYRQGKPMDIYCTERVEQALKREFHYVFSQERYPGIPELNLHRIENKPFELHPGCEVIPIEVMHYKMPVLGFRFKGLTYITDAKTVSEEEIDKVKGTDVLIVNALHHSQHLSHFNLTEALEFIDKVEPGKAYLTHISHLFGRHEEIERLLPPNVFPAFDGLQIELR
jgi:phosphoribosyl 1,2-cyclic phosphate phosphodiesterase